MMSLPSGLPGGGGTCSYRVAAAGSMSRRWHLDAEHRRLTPFQNMKTQRHKGHREDGISPRNSVLSVPLCYKKISPDFLERMGSTLMLGVEDMVRTVGRIASLPRNMLHSEQSTPSLSASIGSTEYPRQDSNLRPQL